jgi:hypothetical protein
MTNVLFDCDYCEGDVVLSTGPGRTYDFRTGITLEIPEDFATAICQSCGRSYLTSEEAERLERQFATSKQAAECRSLVDAIQRETGYTQRQIVLAAGVTPSHLSHVMAGDKQPSATLFGLLECLARHPEEARRRVEGKHWKYTCPPVIEWTVESLPPQPTPTVQAAPASTSERHLRLVIPTEFQSDNAPKVNAAGCVPEEASCLAG